jgi:hypothetical protein
MLTGFRVLGRISGARPDLGCGAGRTHKGDVAPRKAPRTLFVTERSPPCTFPAWRQTGHALRPSSVPTAHILDARPSCCVQILSRMSPYRVHKQTGRVPGVWSSVTKSARQPRLGRRRGDIHGNNLKPRRMPAWERNLIRRHVRLPLCAHYQDAPPKSQTVNPYQKTPSQSEGTIFPTGPITRTEPRGRPPSFPRAVPQRSEDCLSTETTGASPSAYRLIS